MAIVQKNDFIELEFVARTKENNEIFDTNIKSEIDKAKLNFEPKPFVIVIGKEMAIKGLDKDLEGKEVGKEYALEIQPENAFGKRNPEMVKMIPLKSFLEQKIMPQKGMQLSLDGMIVKIISVSGGRVLVDFNNPLAGKLVSYKYTIKRKVEDEKEKVNALQDFFLRKRFEFEIKDRELTFKVDKGVSKFITVLGKPFEEILGLKVSAVETQPEKEKAETKAQ